MTSSEQLMTFYRGALDVNEGWGPFDYVEPETGPQTYGEIILFRAGGSGQGTLLVGLWRVTEPSTSPMYTSQLGDETFLVLEGEVSIDVLDTGEKLEFGPGQVGSWSKGTRTVWTIKSPFKKLFVVAHEQPMPAL